MGWLGDKIQKLLGRSDIWFQSSLYMRRWRLVHTKWFGVRVHHIVRSDADRELHDHPFFFVSVILKGGYWEHTVDGQRRWYGPGSVILRSGAVLHRLELRRKKLPFIVVDGEGRHAPVEEAAWTLVFRGPISRMWGFLTDDGWMDWKHFTEQRKLHGERSQEENQQRRFAAVSSL